MDINDVRFSDPLLRGSIQCIGSGPGSGVQCEACQRYLPENAISGLRRNGRMSVVRRFFCLFVTFDMLFTGLIWFISVVLNGNFDFYHVFYSQIVHYHMQTSFFDIVIVAVIRFLTLIIFYGIFQIDHWIIIAITTTLSCIFLVSKVYVFHWSESKQPVIQVLLILSSFIISWTEVWFFDLRVIPKERYARACTHMVSITDETSPLVRHIQANSRFDTFSESIGTFYSPVGSEASGDEGENTQQQEENFSDEMLRLFMEKGKEILDTSWTLLSEDGWKLEKETQEGDKISSKKLTTGKQVFKFSGEMDSSVSQVFDVLVTNIEDIPNWNPSMKESKILRILDDCSDICYQLTSEMGGGIIKGRDFVLLRHWEEKYDHTIIANISVSCPWAPHNKKCIRGENGPGCWAIRNCAQDGKCELTWLLNTDIKGWLPEQVVYTSSVNVMLNYISLLRKHLAQLNV